jgi:hypothetical protein
VISGAFRVERKGQLLAVLREGDAARTLQANEQTNEPIHPCLQYARARPPARTAGCVRRTWRQADLRGEAA